MFSKIKSIISLLILFTILIPFLWFKNGYFIAWTDGTLPLRPLKYLETLIYMWSNIPNSGNPNVISPTAFFLFGPIYSINFIVFHFNVTSLQKIFFSLWLFLPILAALLLYNYLFKAYAKKYLYIFFVILFYSFNLYRATMFGDVVNMSIYAAEPLILLFVIRAINEERNYLRYAILIALSSLIASGAGANPPMYVVFLLPPILYIFIILIESFFKKNFLSKFYSSIKFIALTTSVSILVNIYWILPFLYQYIGTAASGLKGANLLDWSLGTSAVTSITNIIRMQGAWDWYSGVGTDPYVPYAANYQNNPILLLLGFLLPILAFSALYFVRNRYTIFFTLITIVGIIFSQGSHPPFGPVYNFLTQHVPLFWMFRSSWYKFSFLIALGYSFLGAISVSYIFDTLIKRKSKILNLKLAYIFLLFIIFGTLIYVYPFIDGEKFPKKGVHKILPASQIQVPDYVYKSADWINGQKETFRTFVFPNMPSFIYKWDFNGLTDVSFYLYDKGELYTSNQVGTAGSVNGIGEINAKIFSGVYYEDSDNALRLSGVLSSKYLIEKGDIRYDFYGGYDSPQFVNYQLKNIQGLNLANTFGDWNFYKLSDKYFLPLFYVPEKLVYSESDVSSLGDILSLSNSSRPQVLFSDFINNRDNMFVKTLTNDYITKANCVLCSNNDLVDIENKIQVPFVQLLPDSPFYFFIQSKEKKQMVLLENLPDQLIDLDLNLANKRLSELSKILERGSRDNSDILIRTTIQKYKNFIGDALIQVNNLSEGEKNEKLVEILAYIHVQDKFLKSLPNTDIIPQSSSGDLSIYVSDVLNKLKADIWMTTEEENKKIIFNLNQNGVYDFLIKNSPTSISKVLIDSKEYSSIKSIKLSKGTHRLELKYPQPENLFVAENSSSSGSFSLSYGEKKVFSIKDFDYRNTYLIKFDYKITQGKAPNIMLVQNNDQKDWDGNVSRKYNSLLDDDGKWHTFEYTLTPNLGAKNASLEFYSSGFDYSQSTFEIKNFIVNRTFVPQIYLIKNLNSEDKSIPDITFTKINPAEYKVHVGNAQKPFILNFGENFDNGWKAYVIQKQKSKIKDEKENVVASYFSGQIKELEPQNKFIDENFTLTLFSKPIPSKNHLKTNGYANGWFIDKKGDYDIIIEYWPQRLFYFGIIVSGLSIVLSAFLILIRKKNEKN